MLVPIQKKVLRYQNDALTALVPVITACYRAKQELCPNMYNVQCTHYHESGGKKNLKYFFDAHVTHNDSLMFEDSPIAIYQSHFCHNFPHTCHRFESL